jgi:hypothetical protein
MSQPHFAIFLAGLTFSTAACRDPGLEADLVVVPDAELDVQGADATGTDAEATGTDAEATGTDAEAAGTDAEA